MRERRVQLFYDRSRIALFLLFLYICFLETENYRNNDKMMIVIMTQGKIEIKKIELKKK